jgi:holo-[acyl-carrier protein] synthase
MIYGVGIDIIEIDRIGDMHKKWGEKFLEKIFTQKEIEYCLEKVFSAQHLAARFACKEAFFKAASSIPGFEFNWKSIEILNTIDGKPLINLLYPDNSILRELQVHLSISHSTNHATAVVILEKI